MYAIDVFYLLRIIGIRLATLAAVGLYLRRVPGTLAFVLLGFAAWIVLCAIDWITMGACLR